MTTEKTKPTTELIESELAQTLPNMRFFADKNAKINGVDVLESIPAVRNQDGAPDVDVLFVRVRIGDASNRGPLYQVPIAWSEDLPEASESALLVKAEGVVGYDALTDAAAIAALGTALVGNDIHPLELNAVPGGTLAAPKSGRAMGVEQSNTSVIFDDSVMCKFFRRLHPGTNADVELLSALSQANCSSVPQLHGWVECEVDGQHFTTAMLQEFVPNSADGWAMALTSVRDAIRDRDSALEYLGTDFGIESASLGGAVAAVHHSLAAALPAKRRVSGAELVAPMRVRLAAVSKVVPEVAEIADAAEKVYAAAEAAIPEEGAIVQRIHGDLHLGQVLRTPREWLLIDFEGEPSRPWEERRLPDHPLRDVAGMLRSFDYAAHYPLLTSREVDAEVRPRVEAWAQRNIDEFLSGYQLEGNQELLDAFILDKAVYECLYEAQNRPDWLELPLAAVRRLLG